MANSLPSQIEQARTLIKQSKNITAFSGAGLSAESGIATFRDKDTGALWDKYDPTHLASQAGFQENQRLVIDWYNWRRQNIAKVTPNPAHEMLATTANDQQRCWYHVTQNVDNLLERAGVPEKEVIHLHGTITKNHCNSPNCNFQETVDLSQPPELQLCPQCQNDHMRPSVVWFGESLPDTAWNRAMEASAQCDLLLVIGTSAQVYPAANLIPTAKQAGAAIIVINTQPSGASAIADIELIGAAGEILPALLAD